MPTPTPPPADDPPEYFETPAPTVPPRKRLSRRATVIGSVIALVVVAGVGWLAWDLTRPAEQATVQRGPGGPGGAGGGRSGPGGRGATTVGVATAEVADIPVVIEALGTVVPLATVRVRPQVSGPLQSVQFKEGQNVRKGQLLATIDPRPFEMALQQAVGQRMRDEAQLAAAKVTLGRYETLLKQDSIARQDVDTQAATVHQLEAAVVADKANEGTARLNLGYTRIAAPIDGRVGLRNVDVGNTVSPGDTNGIVMITQLTPIEVEFAIPQDHAAWLQQNLGAYMEVKAFDRTRSTVLDTGTFTSLDNQIDTQTGTVRAKARFNNARQQLFPSQFVNVQVQLRNIKDAVVVPVNALRQSGNGEFVFVLQENRTVKQRPVVRGQPLGERIQVASGLAAGERVITEGADRLRDGSRVLLPGDTPSGQGFQPGAGGRRRAQGGASAASAPGAGDAFPGASAARGPGGGREARGGAAAGDVGAGGAPLPVSPQNAAATGTPSPSGAGQGRGQRGTAQAEGGASAPRGGAPTAAAGDRPMTDEEREARRQRFQNMSPEDRARLRAEMEKLSPEEREARRRKFRESLGGGQPPGGGQAQ